MSNAVNHLNEKATRWLDLSNKERINKIYEERWIGYTKAKEILDRMESLLNRPRVHRMKNLLIVGDTNNGKTKIINRFQSLHPGDDNIDGDAIILPVMLIQCPPTPDENRLYDEILKKLNAPYKRRDSPSKKLHEVMTIFDRIEVRMLILDEIHNILAGSPAQQRRFCNVLKYLGNELKITIVAAGIDQAFNVLQTDPQVGNRFDSVVLPRWEFDEEYLRLLASFERIIPLRERSNLAHKNIALKLLSMSEGLIGELSDLLNEAAELAINKKKERIDLELLRELKWQKPSNRKFKIPPKEN